LPLLLGPAQAVPELLDAVADPLPVQLFTERSGSCWAAVNTPMTADRVRGAMSVPMTPALYSADPDAAALVSVTLCIRRFRAPGAARPVTRRS
jgi:hypothetical protein